MSSQKNITKAGTAKRVTVPSIVARKIRLNSSKNQHAESKIVALTAYDFSMASVLDASGIDVILVGDSLGTVFQGHETTIPVTLEEIIYHSRCVSRGVSRALVVGDLPFLSYQTSISDAICSAGRLLKEGGVAAVKLEGGVAMAATISSIVNVDIPVMGHIGLTPQSYHRMGGHKIQGKKRAQNRTENRTDSEAGQLHSKGTREAILEDAKAVEDAGAFAVVLEGIPADLADEITKTISIPTIGIGAGVGCDGQILVINDLLGMDPEFSPKFVKRYAEIGEVVKEAVGSYIQEVRTSKFPSAEHSFQSDDSTPGGTKAKLKLA